MRRVIKTTQNVVGTHLLSILVGRAVWTEQLQLPKLQVTHMYHASKSFHRFGPDPDLTLQLPHQKNRIATFIC